MMKTTQLQHQLKDSNNAIAMMATTLLQIKGNNTIFMRATTPFDDGKDGCASTTETAPLS
jgi:hypothetical protein